MKRKLKTWEQFEDEFRLLSYEWVEYEYYAWTIIVYNGMRWHISPKKKELFGTEIEVTEIRDFNYTHIGMGIGNRFFWHELWFEQEFKEIEFLSEEEVNI